MNEESKVIFNQIAGTKKIKAEDRTPDEKELIKKLEEGSARGLTKTQVAASIGWSPVKIFGELKKDERLAVAIESGRAKLNERAMAVIIDKVDDGDLRAACFVVSHLEKMVAREEQYALRRALEETDGGQTLIEMLIASKGRVTDV